MNLKNKQDDLLKKHQIRLTEIRSLLRHGDWKKIEKQTGLSQSNAHHAFNRVGSINHFKVVKAAELVIDLRLNKFKNNK